MYTMFKTAKGSTYVRLPTGQTIRTKNSPGKGQGETDKQVNNCLFVTAIEADRFLVGPDSFGTKYRLGYAEVKPNGAPGAFHAFGPAGVDVPANCQATVVVLDNVTGDSIAWLKAAKVPAIGLTPVEHRYEGDLSIRHVGNPIVAIQEVSL